MTAVVSSMGTSGIFSEAAQGPSTIKGATASGGKDEIRSTKSADNAVPSAATGCQNRRLKTATATSKASDTRFGR